MSPLYYIVALALALVLVFSANTVSRSYEAAARYETASEQADTKLKRALEWLTFGLYEGARQKGQAVEELLATAAYHQRRVIYSAWALLGVSALFVAVCWARSRRAADGAAIRLAGHLLGVSGVFLLVGLTAPILTVVAQKEVTLLGNVVFQYETRSILGTAERLANSGNTPVALLLFLFSAVIPVSKLSLSFLALSPAATGIRRGALRTVR
ncbi:MAG: paraquat-inducible protein A, partial [Gammaproteobacteria bacterium]|nr:paraquat-inducible protein A [Gammaproteobacteria bacterium]